MMPNLDFCFIDERLRESVQIKKIFSAFKSISAPNVAVKVAVTKDLVTVNGPKVAVVFG